MAVPPDCSSEMGITSQFIQPAAMTASGAFTPAFAATCGRLVVAALGGCTGLRLNMLRSCCDQLCVFGAGNTWIPSSFGTNQWLQVDFGATQAITGVATSGRVGTT